MTSPECAYWYALNVIKGQWPEAEAYLRTDPRFFKMYRKNVLKSDLTY